MIIFALAVPTLAWSEQPYTPRMINPLSEPWRWKHFPELEGKGIRYIAETEDQTIWVSCNEGVLEYDGYHWKTHDANNGLTASPVEQLLVTESGVIYATSTQGIFRYNGSNWEHYFRTPDNFLFTFYRIKELSDGSIMACSNRGALHFGADDQLSFYTSAPKADQLRSTYPEARWVMLPKAVLHPDDEDFIYISDVLETENNRSLWLAITTQAEVGTLLVLPTSELDNERLDIYEAFVSTGNIQLGEEQKLLETPEHDIWVINSTSNKGIAVYDGENWETIHLNRQFGGDEYMADIIQLGNGSIWISSMAKVFVYDHDGWHMYKAPSYPIPANRVLLKNSSDGKVWVAGYKSRVTLLDASATHWESFANLSFQCEVGPREQWFLEADDRIVYRQGDRWTAYGVEDGLMDSPISIIATSRGQIWAAGSHQGVAATAVLRNGRWERHLHPRLSWGIDYRAVFEARNGSLWFGGSVDAEREAGFQSGLLELPDPLAQDLQWIHHRYQENGLSQANVYGIGQSPDGRIWIGGSRLQYFDGESWHAMEDERLQQFVNVVYSTNGLLLVGSRYYGLFVYDGSEWKNYSTASGLSGNTIISIDALSKECILVATENDICRFDGHSWTSNILPEKLNMDFEGGTILHTDDDTFWINHVPRSWKRRVYQNIREEDASWEFFTTRYQPSSQPPETSIDFFLETVSQEGNSLISWTGRDFFAETPSDRLMYAYRLNGGEWSEYTFQQQHTFTSLPSGDHTLEVRARDLDFNVDPTPATIAFRVLPPIHQQAWFIALISAFLLTFGIYEYRVLTKKRKLEILNDSLQEANRTLKEKGRKIEAQNQEILYQQDRILRQAQVLESNNKDLEERNRQVREQRDKLEDMVVQVENLSKAKLAFFTNISHELRTPLSLILGPTAQLQREDEKLRAGERKQLYSIIHRNASRLLKLINQLLEMRRIEHHSLELKLSDIPLPEYLEDVIVLFKDLAIQRDILLDFVNTMEAKRATLDADKLEKILVNLLSNAFKHTPRGGSIVVSLDRVQATDRKLNPIYEHYLEIAVEDSGRGIKPETLEHIFDQYYTSGSDLVGEESSGIGLPYIKELTYLMQGEIRVQSHEGAGTRFLVYLPYIVAREHAPAPAAGPRLKIAREEASVLIHSLTAETTADDDDAGDERQTARPRILVVEDNPEMRFFLQNYLRGKFLVVGAEDGKKGLAIAQKQAIDLIISDVMMPEMDGLSFCRKIKENPITSHIPVILLTAKALEDNKMEGFLIGADDYITKPFNPELLEVRINNLLQQREQLREAFNKAFLLTPETEQVSSPDQEFLQKLVDIMNENLADPEFNVEKMCKMVYLSHMHFIRKVKQLTGKKPVDLLKSFRMKKAQELLAQKKLSISEVAYRVGFDLPNSFSRAFKKEFNITPSDFVAGLEEEEVAETTIFEDLDRR